MENGKNNTKSHNIIQIIIYCTVFIVLILFKTVDIAYTGTGDNNQNQDSEQKVIKSKDQKRPLTQSPVTSTNELQKQSKTQINIEVQKPSSNSLESSSVPQQRPYSSKTIKSKDLNPSDINLKPITTPGDKIVKGTMRQKEESAARKSSIKSKGVIYEIEINLISETEVKNAKEAGIRDPEIGTSRKNVGEQVLQKLREKGIPVKIVRKVKESELHKNDEIPIIDNLSLPLETGTQYLSWDPDPDYFLQDQYGVWVTWNVTSVPAGAQVTSVEYRVRVAEEDAGETDFYCSDYIISFSTQNHGKDHNFCKVWNRDGGQTDNNEDDDSANDYDIYLDSRTTSCFNGENVNQEWYAYVGDFSAGDDGIINYIEIWINWETPQQEFPDLTCDLGWWSDSNPSEFDLFWFKARIVNEGTATAGACKAWMFLSLDDDWDTNDDWFVAPEKDVPSLGQGASTEIQWDFNFPDMGSEPYDVSVLVFVDAYDGVSESNENNNLVKWSYVIHVQPPQQPDLTSPSVTYQTPPAMEGQSYWIRPLIKNEGDGTAVASHVKIFLSTDNDFDTSDDYEVTPKKSVPSLSPGDENNPQWDFIFPNLNGQDIGVCYDVWIITVVDCDDEVAESNESNTYKTNNPIMASDPIQQPDLTAPSVNYQPTEPTEGEQFCIWEHICNEGDGTAAASHVRIFLSTDNDFDTSDDYEVTPKKSVPSLASGECTNPDIEWCFAFPDLASGDYNVWIVALVDCDNEVDETNENNTFKTTNPILVHGGEKPDLICASTSFKSYDVTEGEPFWIKPKIKNEGNATANPSHVKLFLSPGDDWDISDDTEITPKKSVPSLAPGDESDPQWDFNFPDMGSGNYDVWIVKVVDCDDEVDESDENNIFKTTNPLQVSEAEPDIDVNPTTLDIYENGSGYSPTDPLGENDEMEDIEQTSNDEHALGLIIPEHVKEYWRTHTPQLMYDLHDLQASINWSSNDSPVKNQGGCGSCWAFAAVGLVENLGNKNDLSEQVIVSCANGDCGGGWYWDAFEYIKNQGISPESCYPYTATNGNCSNKCSDPAYLVKLTQHTPANGLWGENMTVNDLKAALQSGPLCVAMRVPQDGSFNPNYSGGIYNYDGEYIPWDADNPNGHAVLLVGYDDDQQCFKRYRTPCLW